MIRKAEVNMTVLYLIMLSFSGFIVPYIEPQLAGLWGGGMYLVVRHESKTGTMSITSLMMVLLMGYTGAWAVVHALPILFIEINDVFVQILAFSAGFMMYDFYMAWGANTTSVIGVLGRSLQGVFERVTDRWTP